MHFSPFLLDKLDVTSKLEGHSVNFPIRLISEHQFKAYEQSYLNRLTLEVHIEPCLAL